MTARAIPQPVQVDVALVHYPVVNKNQEIIGSAVTNLDIHDIARAGRTFGVGTFYIVTPYQDQQKLVAVIEIVFLSFDNILGDLLDRMPALLDAFDEIYRILQFFADKFPFVVGGITLERMGH